MMHCHNVSKAYINAQVVFPIDVSCKYNIYTPNSKYASGKSLLCIDPNFDESRHKTILKLNKPWKIREVS